MRGARGHIRPMKNLKLTNEEAEALARELDQIVGNERSSLSPRIKTLKAILGKLREEQATPGIALVLEVIGGVFLGFVSLEAARRASFAANFSTNSLVPLVFLLAILVGWPLFVVRQQFRLAYSVVELMAGVLTIFCAIKGAPAVVPDEATERLMLLVLAGIYIFIRGLDNVAQSRLFKGNPKARAIFEGSWAR